MAIYFVDVMNGKLENDGLSEKSPVSDYETLDIKAGDTVLFKRGSFIRDKLKNKEGEEGNPITYAAYGDGEKPTFCGSISLNNEALWTEESHNIWVCSSPGMGEPANFIFNKSNVCGTLRWTKEELKEQGDFFDHCFGVSNGCRVAPGEHKTYMYSKKNPALFYSDIECVMCRAINLADNGHDMTFEDLRFINNGFHAIAGESKSRNIKVENCSFEFIGGAVYDDKRRIRYGNAVEFWDVGENIEVSNCLFNNIYDSAVTHQGSNSCEPCVNMNIHHNVFMKCGMAAYEQRDRLPLYASFNDNICIGAGEGFSKNGEQMPRYSEIWPQPMGHHIFLWRINQPTDGGQLEIKNNIFYNAPYGAAVYSIICRKAEAQIKLENNTYYTENKALLNRWQGRDYRTFDEYENCESGCKYKKINIDQMIRRRKTR